MITYSNIETAYEELQRSHATEQAKTRRLARKAKELSKEVEQVQGRGKVLNQAADRFKEVEQVPDRWRP